jgi:hypothetical protein
VEGVRGVTGEQLQIGTVVKVVATMVFFASAAFPQVVIGPEQIPCSEEVVRSNFELKEKIHVSGELRDSSGAQFANWKVILKKADHKEKFVLYRAISTNKDGHFDLGVVEAGRYRFLPAPNRGFKQPVSVLCYGGRDCDIDLILQANSSDQPFAGCLIQ